MYKELRLLSTLFLLLLLGACTPSTEDNKEEVEEESLPNVIMLIGDDHGYPYFGFMGADYVETPYMDELAANGTLFTDGYVTENHCRPSLQSLITGLLPVDYYREAFRLMDEEIEKKGLENQDSIQAEMRLMDTRGFAMPYFNTLPKILAEKGYVSFQGGKWWEFSYKNGGFTHGMTQGWTMEEHKEGGWFEKHMGGDGMDLGRVSNEAAYQFLEETKGKPFFMWLAPSLPHYPFDAPDKYYNLYKDKDMSESAKRYYANCTWFDDAWGDMVKYLKAHDLYDNTLIVYVNDNGWEQEPKQEFWDDPMRSHNGGDKGKSSIFDMSFRSPIIFAYGDKIKKGIRTDALIYSTDIPATILDYAGVAIPEDMDGISFKAVLDGKKESLRANIIGNVINKRSTDPKNVMGVNTAGFWIREDNWFLRWDADANEKQLFDLSTDLRNDHDVSAEHPEIFQKLMTKLESYRTEKGVDARLAYYRKIKEGEK